MVGVRSQDIDAIDGLECFKSVEQRCAELNKIQLCDRQTPTILKQLEHSSIIVDNGNDAFTDAHCRDPNHARA